MWRYALELLSWLSPLPVIGGKVVPFVRILIALFFVFAKPVSMALDATLGEDIGTVFTRRQLAEIIDIHEKQEMIDKDESSIIRGAMTFGNKTARSIMTPVNELFMASISTVLDRVLIHSILASGFSRILVHGDSVNDIIGTIHVKDLIFVDPKENTLLSSFFQIFGRTTRSVAPDCRLSALLETFKTESAHLVLVKQPQTTDASGDMHTLLGIVTLEDVLEEILQAEILDEGDISDRRHHDSERKRFLLRRFDDAGRLGLDDLCQADDPSEDELAVGLVQDAPLIDITELKEDDMVKKKVDARVRTLLENCIQENFRSFVVLVGDHGKDQVMNLHYILSKAAVKARPRVLWCYKKELGFSTHRQKRMRQIKKQQQRGLYDPSKDDPFELFIASTDIRWCYYKETHKVLGSTYGMCVLQDFEAVTPNIMARTIETVEGGGVVVLLLRTMDSLKQLYTMSMDVHARFRTESHQDVVARFNERFILSLASCERCVVLDDELNVLPISKHTRKIEPLPPRDSSTELTKDELELQELKTSLRETQPVGALVEQARTLDQAKAILTFVEAVSEKTLRSTVALTAGRGRGKSAALGMALAGAVAYGYSNIFVTAPTPENLKTVFDFVFKGFDALKYKEHLDYEIVQSTNPEFNHAVVRVNIFREHRQTIQYIQPTHHEKLAQAELVAIDEAAAIPLPVVKNLLGPYLVFMSSTINGYEGTGRSLSLKLLQKLREQQGSAGEAAARAASSIHGDQKRRKGEQKLHEERWQAASNAAHAAAAGSASSSARVLREVTLETPIRYAPNDPVERWLNALLCLDATNASHRLVAGTPHPRDCELYYVNRDSLFSYHKLSESFLQRIMSLYVSSHYKNTPNDLQLLSDAPAHHVFALLGPGAEAQGNAGQLPDVLCVVQVALEGDISKASVKAQLARGQRASGDLIPWTVAQQFQDSEFAALSGARVVRIATHPDVTGMGYGSRAIELLTKYYQGEITSDVAGAESEEKEEEEKVEDDDEDEKKSKLRKEKIKPRKTLPPLLLPLDERPCERLHWFGTSFGLTLPLHNFWSRGKFRSVYIRQTANDLTGEHTAIMLRSLRCDDLPAAPADGWLDEFVADSRRRFTSLLSYDFSKFPCALALGLLSDEAAGSNATSNGEEKQITLHRSATGEISPAELAMVLTPYDAKRLKSYAKNMVDYHMIVDLIPSLARLYFLQRLPQMSLSYLQRAILVSLGLQHQSVDVIQQELNVPSNQLLALFNKAVRKFLGQIEQLMEKQLEEETANSKKMAQIAAQSHAMTPTKTTLDEEMREGAQEEKAKQQQKLLDSLNLMKYAVRGDDADWDAALAQAETGGAMVQVKSKKQKKEAKDTKDSKKEHKHNKRSADGDSDRKKNKKSKKSKYANL
ncbi:RNA cytidine acetyltransferase [Phytophthora citrophthora]|uniref:RNA cytidine acetyltransferase n=1 Tax=Phytophthora citrophthora TaxID=4793 RepID=A0AAD9FY82_9STRA|nr:RNA cytidine acetyltransferase [Phytophthora citrophthora]